MCCSRLDSQFFASSLVCSLGRGLLRLLTPAILILCFLGLSGCNPFARFSSLREVHIPQGKCAEIREPIRIKVWSHDKDGNPVKGYVNGYAGYLVAPATPTVPAFKISEIK